VVELRPELQVIAGPNGSGKTTVTQKLLGSRWSSGVVYINPDEIAQNEFDGWNDPPSIKKAADLADMRRRAAIAEGKPLAFETVFSTSEKVQFISDAAAAGYFVRLFCIGTSRPGINVDRIATRYQRGGRAVSIEKIVSRYFKSISNAALVAANVARFYLYDKWIDDQGALLKFRASNGVVVRAEHPVPAWSKSIYDSQSAKR